MKIHKINLENYYRNLMMESIRLRQQATGIQQVLPYTPYPQYTEMVVKCNTAETLTVGLPSLPASRIAVRNQSTGLYDYTFLQYATASIVGLTSDKSIPLGEFSLQQDANGIYWLDDPNDAQTPTLNLYTIPTTVNKLKVVISFKSQFTARVKQGNRWVNKTVNLISNDSIEAMTVNVKWEDTSNSPSTVLDVDSVEANNLVARVEALEEAANAEDTPAAGEE